MTTWASWRPWHDHKSRPGFPARDRNWVTWQGEGGGVWGAGGGTMEEKWNRPPEFHGCYFSLCVSKSEGQIFSQCGRFLLATVASHSNAHGRLCVCCVAVKGSRKYSHSVVKVRLILLAGLFCQKETGIPEGSDSTILLLWLMILLKRE